MDRSLPTLRNSMRLWTWPKKDWNECANLLKRWPTSMAKDAEVPMAVEVAMAAVVDTDIAMVSATNGTWANTANAVVATPGVDICSV